MGDTAKGIMAAGVGALGAATLVLAIVKLVQLPIAIMPFALAAIQFLVSILGIVGVLAGIAVGVLIVVKAMEKAFDSLGAQVRELREAILETAKGVKQIEATLPLFLSCIAELAVFTLGSDFEPGDKGLLAVYVLAVIAVIHLSFGEGRNRIVGWVGMALLTVPVAGYGIVFRAAIYARYSRQFQGLELRNKLALLLVLAMILLVTLVALLSARERRRTARPA